MSSSGLVVLSLSNVVTMVAVVFGVGRVIREGEKDSAAAAVSSDRDRFC